MCICIGFCWQFFVDFVDRMKGVRNDQRIVVKRKRQAEIS